MTTIKPATPVKRETAATVRRRHVIIELHPEHIRLRLKGERQGFSLSYQNLIWRCYSMAGEEPPVERKAEHRKENA